MTEQETRLILNVLKANYPNSFRIDKNESMALFNLWKMQFQNIPYRIVEDAVNSIISSDEREFAPNIGQVKNKIMDNLAPDVDEKAIHAWESFRKFIGSTSTWSTMEEELPMYNKLDEITRRLYTYREAKSLAQLDKNTLEYRRSEFIRLYKNITLSENKKRMDSGDLVALADGKERFLALGYTSADVEKLEGNYLTDGKN